MLNQSVFQTELKKSVLSKVCAHRGFIIAANWKMNLSEREAADYFTQLNKLKAAEKDRVILFVPSPFLYLARGLLTAGGVAYGVQNLFFENAGAFTGEISPAMAKVYGCGYAIVGHSERRNLFGETDEMISKKVRACLANGISPMLCIGENAEERKENRYRERLGRQLEKALGGLSDGLDKITVAYEPVWAIGTGMNATAAQAAETHAFIREKLTALLGEAGAKVPILYGGSVKDSNILDFVPLRDVSGFLIGGYSLKAENMAKIIRLLGGGPV